MKIYDTYGNLLLETEVSDRSGLYTSIDNRSELTLMFTIDRYMEIPVGSWCEFEGGRYELMSAADVKMNHTESYGYTMLMSSDYSLTSRFKVRNTVDGRLKFDMVAKPHELLQLIVDNLNQRSAGWSVGTCIDSVEKMVSFNHTTCEEALNAIAAVFETELEVVGKKVSLGKVEYNRDTPLALGYGKGNGFRPGIQKTKVFGGLPVEKLFIQGGSRNISLKDYGSSELHLPKSLSFLFDGSLFEGENGFDASMARRFVTDADGSCVMLSEISSGMEDSLDLSEVYPSRVGIVSHVIFIFKGAEYTAPVSSWTDDDWNEVQIDIIDDTIPDGLDYKECTIEGETMTLVFQSGILAGREFGADFISGRNRFEIVKEEIDGQPMPQGVFIPSVGDTYAVFNVSLPDSYISSPSTYSGAEYDALREASRYLYENCVIKFSFTGELDGIWAKKDWVNIGSRIRVGGYVSFTHEGMFPDEPALVRIVGVTQYVNNPHSPKIELSNATGHVTVSSRLNQVERNEAHVEELHKEAKRYTKRTFNDAKSAIALIEKALGDKFSESIKPATVQTMMMLVGDESLQFMFVDSVGSSTQVAHSESYDAESKTFSCSAGVLKHMTLGINEIRSGLDQNYMYWSMEAYESAMLADASAEYYVYAVVQRNGSSGVFRLETSPVGMYDIEGSYYLLLGLLLGEYEGSRSYMPLYGFTQVLPGQITTDVIRSADGKTFFDLVQGIIGGRITFSSGSSGLENLSEWSGKQSQIDKALNDAKNAALSAALANASVSNLDEKITDVETGVNKSIQEINQKLDGVVESYFDAYTPTRSNLPASEWIANGTEAEHIGDTFTNTALDGDDAGKSWRWLEQEDGTYDWQPIADSDAAKALALAGQAKETADGKSRTFLVKPSNYSKGDLWIVGSDFVPSGYAIGSLLCASASSTTYVASHWSEKVRYTDDTTANEAKTLAESAKTVADAAQTAADTAKKEAQDALKDASDAKAEAESAASRLDELTADGYISPMEKLSLKNEMAQIDADYDDLANEVNKYILVDETTLWNAYDNAYDLYRDDMLSKINTDGSVAVGSLSSLQSSYYSARTNLLNAIYAAAKKLADDAQESADAANALAQQAKELADTVDAATKNLDTKIGNVETGLLEDVDEINRRLDGVVENYFEEGTPTLSSYPANEWTTDTDKKNHLGDTYTNIQEFVDEETTPDAGKSWRWTYTDGEHTGYHWHPIADSDAVKALLEASRAKAAADGKSRTFVAEPIPPYSVGDLWVQGDSGDIMKCIVERSSGAYVASDWEKASKYTDDTTAEEAKELAQQAKDAAEAAQTDATEANNAVNDLVENTLPALEDGIIDEAEKMAIEKYLNIVNKEFADVTATHNKLYANALLPEASKSALLLAYNNLKLTTTSLLNVINGAILESPTHTAEQVNIAYSNYRDKFAAYSTAIETAYAAIEGVIDEKATAAKEVAEAAKEATDALDDDLTFTVVEKRSIRKALKDINPSQEDYTEPLRWEVSARAAVSGNAWTKVTDSKDANYGWYVSNMHTANSSSIVSITLQVNRKSDIEVSIMSRAESSFDYTLLSLIDTTLLASDTYSSSTRVATTTRNKQGQAVSHVFKDVSAGTHFFTVMYRKDSGGDTAPDNGYYRIADAEYDSGSLGDWMNIVAEKGLDNAICSLAVNAADSLFSYLYGYKVWTNENTAVPSGFRDEVYRLFQDYYKEVSAILVNTATSDLDYLANAMRNGKTITDGGLVMTSLVAVGDTQDVASADVEAFMNGSDFASDATHGKLMHALGIPTETSAGSTDLEERAKEAKTRMYEDGYTVTRTLELKEGCRIGILNVTENGISAQDGCSDVTGGIREFANFTEYGFYVSKVYNTGSACVTIGSTQITAKGIYLSSSLSYDREFYAVDTRYFHIGFHALSCKAGLVVGSMTVAEEETMASERDGKYSVYAREGVFAGLRPNTEKLTTGRTLTELDHTIVIASGTLYLPSSPEDGQHYRIIHTSTTSLIVRNGSSTLLNILKFKTETSKIYTFTSTTKEIIDMTYCADDATWYVVFY